MAATLIEPTQPIEVKQICALFYGQPGSRKSSLLQTADSPITLAFDPGIYRAFGRKTAALFGTWADVLGFDLAPYKTVGTDTIGMCLDKLSGAIIADNPKHGNRLGGLSLQGYGQLKTQFASWVAAVKERGQSLVFLAHEKAEKNGEETYYCPDIVGGSYNTLMNHCDVVGYMHFDGGKRVLDFAPTDRWMAKCPPCGWTDKERALPDFGQEPDYLAKLLQRFKESMGRVSEQSAALAAAVAQWQSWLAKTPNLEAFNNGLKDLGTLTNGAKAQAWHLVQQYAEGQGWMFDKAGKVFRSKEAA